MSSSCPRCGYPNGPGTHQCRACKTTLDGGAVRLTPRLQAVLKKARHQERPDNRIDRLPGGLPSPQQIRARRESLSSERRSGLSQLRRRLDRLDGARPTTPAPERTQHRSPQRPTDINGPGISTRSPQLPAAAPRSPQLPVSRASGTPAPVSLLDSEPGRHLDPLSPLLPVNEEAQQSKAGVLEFPEGKTGAASERKSSEALAALTLAATAYVEEEEALPPAESVPRVADEIDGSFADSAVQSLDEDGFRSSEPFLVSHLETVTTEASPAADDFRSSEPFLLSHLEPVTPVESPSLDGSLPMEPSLPDDLRARIESESSEPLRAVETAAPVELETPEPLGAVEIAAPIAFESSEPLARVEPLATSEAQGVPTALSPPESPSEEPGFQSENDDAIELEPPASEGVLLARFGWRRLGASSVDLFLPSMAFLTVIRAHGLGGALPPEELIARFILGESGRLGFGLCVFIGMWFLTVGLSCLWSERTFGMRLFGLTWQGGSRGRIILRLPLSLVCLVPLGLGLSWAWVDSNSRTLADHVLGLRWQGPAPRP